MRSLDSMIGLQIMEILISTRFRRSAAENAIERDNTSARDGETADSEGQVVETEEGRRCVFCEDYHFVITRT